MTTFPKILLSVGAILFLLGIGPCDGPSPPSTTDPVGETPAVNVKCETCIKDVPGCMNELLNTGQPFCDALIKCETNIKCDACITIGYQPYLTWRKFKLDGRVCSQ
mgnify:CR=1 FL=1